jgi:hypothetical protein
MQREGGGIMFKFTSLSAAKSFTGRASKIMCIILGDDEKFWVVTPREAKKLVSQGYEYAEA